MDKIDKIEKYPHIESYWPAWLSWSQTSYQALAISESKLFKYVKNTCNLFFVPIKNNTQYLRTLIASKLENTENKILYDKKIPIVMVHGMCAGIGLWCKNIDSISNNRKLYAMDLLGFAFSSRPKFPTDPKEVENTFTDSLEEWRKSLGLDKFVLLGHSFGGFLACSYAIKYPQNVRHLILADPWGIAVYDPSTRLTRSLTARTIFSILKSFNPLAIVRAAGPFGLAIIRKSRPDLGKYFEGIENQENVLMDNSVSSDDVFDYIYHCNVQYPSGESAFRTLSYNLGWAFYPMLDRVNDLDKDVPVSFIYGEKSWMDKNSALKFKEQRPDSYVDYQTISNCGHHIYAEDANDFNEKVNKICEKVDSGEDIIFTK